MKKHIIGTLVALTISAGAAASDRTVYSGHCEKGVLFHAVQDIDIESSIMHYDAELLDAQGDEIAHQVNGDLPGMLLDVDGGRLYNIRLVGQQHSYMVVIKGGIPKAGSSSQAYTGNIITDSNYANFSDAMSCSFSVADNIYSSDPSMPIASHLNNKNPDERINTAYGDIN
ncbi:TPA: hypothetical protein N3282_004477 [Klebsiella aerogenes]|nr:hypothetical protein [Klebsiella aerogenes]